MAEETVRPLCELDVGDTFEFPSGDTRHRLIDCIRPGEYSNWVWAYEDAETGDYEGLIEDGAGPAATPTMVRHVGSAATTELM